MIVIDNFLYEICSCQGDWQVSSFIEETVKKLRREIGKEKVLLALSGGVDSSVTASLFQKAIGKNLTCIFVDHGLLRKGESDEIVDWWGTQKRVTFMKIDARERFLKALQGITEPEEKRKMIGKEFIQVFEEEAQKLGKIKYLAQGTIYPDVIESGKGSGAVIKSHHNVGGLPLKIAFEEIIEPLRYLFKDEVRKVGCELGLPRELMYRQPFPGPGLAIRMMGEVTESKLKVVKESDAILREEIDMAGLNNSLSQYFTVLTNTKSVGVMGDERTYENLVAIRAVKTEDFMTGKSARIPYETLEKISHRIVNEVQGVNRVVYDITSKPPATIEWE